MVGLYENGKSRAAIVEEYGLTASALDRWIKQAQTTGSRADHGTKVAIIQNNRDKYSVSAMCDVLQIARSTIYYEAKERKKQDELTTVIVDIFHKNRKAYSTRKIKAKRFVVSDLTYVRFKTSGTTFAC